MSEHLVTKNSFREMLLEAIAEDRKPKTAAELNEGMADGWACSWPDCQLEEYGCGTRYGCSFAKAVAREEKDDE